MIYTYDDLGNDQDREAIQTHDDCMRWRFLKEMDLSDCLRMIAGGTANYDRVIDRLRKVAERNAAIEARRIKRKKK